MELVLIVGRSNKVCVAVMNGCEENFDQRLFQLLPTSKGYRLFSVGNETRAVLYYELLPGRERMSVERVWYRREGEEIHPFHHSNRLAIRYEWR
jgi:hypothetical protein